MWMQKYALANPSIHLASRDWKNRIYSFSLNGTTLLLFLLGNNLGDSKEWHSFTSSSELHCTKHDDRRYQMQKFASSTSLREEEGRICP